MAKRKLTDGTVIDDLVYNPAEDNGKMEPIPTYDGEPLHRENAVLKRTNGSTATLNGNAPAAPTLNGNALYDAYMGQHNAYLDAYKNAQFKYDFNNDPAYQNAKQQYLKQGQLNARNVAAQAAQLTGGYGNSYGTVAAQVQMNQAADRINSIIPELQNAAYSRFADEQNRNLSLADRYLNMANNEYSKALQDAQLRGQYHDFSGLQGLGIDTSKYEADLAEQQAYEKWQRETAQSDHDRSIRLEDEDRARQEEDRQKQEEQDEFNRALQIAQITGNYSGLSKYGDFSSAEKQYQLELGLYYAKNFGDFSILESLGVPTDYMKAQMYGTGTTVSGGGSSGGGRSSGGSSSSGSMSDAELLDLLYGEDGAQGIDAILNNAGNKVTSALFGGNSGSTQESGNIDIDALLNKAGNTVTTNLFGEDYKEKKYLGNFGFSNIQEKGNGKYSVTDPSGSTSLIEIVYDNGRIIGIRKV